MPANRQTAIIDIGSNSVRLVVYSGASRVPSPTFNEKVLAGLGEAVGRTGRLSSESRNKALAALRRFRLLIDHMQVSKTQVIATAAVRDAADGAAFVREVERIGFDCEVITADEEARLAGEGVISAIPSADGIVGDLGGGSLELADVRGGKVGKRVSLPLGVLRITADEVGKAEALQTLREGLRESGLAGAGENRGFYVVGGSWRSLAKIDMATSGFPLPALNQYGFAPERARQLQAVVEAPERSWSKKIATARLASTGVAAMLLSLLVEELHPRELVVSTFGIREGLLFKNLKSEVRALDPLIEGARDAGGSERRFGEHGDVLNLWIDPVFNDPPHLRRIRRAACLLADVAWQASPEFRADRSVEMALHGDWLAITAAERVILAQTLSSSFGRDKLPDPALAHLCSEDDLKRARVWGLAVRLAQRLSGGAGAVLQATSLAAARGQLVLRVHKGETALVGEPVSRRLSVLADVLGLKPKVLA